MTTRTRLGASDLFVVLEKAFRRRARDCGGCTFSIPYRQRPSDTYDDWGILLTHGCSPKCLAILEDVVNRKRREYQLAG